MSAGFSRAQVGVSAIIVIGILLVGTGLFLFVIELPVGPGNTTTTTTTTTSPSTTTTTTTTPPPPAHNPYQVAIVFATGGLGDRSINDACYIGAANAFSDFGISFTYVEPTSISDYETFLRGFAAHAGYPEPYDLIISLGFDQEVALQTVADEFTDQKFAIVDMFIDPGTYPNVTSLLFNEHEGSALVGAMAGLMTETDKIGFVGGMDIPLINKFAAGYVFGANYTNEGINYTIAYTNDWANPGLGQTLANGMYAAGTDVIFGAAGRSGLGVIAE